LREAGEQELQKFLASQIGRNLTVIIEKDGVGKSENFLDVSKDIYGIYIPEKEVLTRKKYQWFAVMDGENILESNTILSKYLKASIVDSTSEYSKSTLIPSAVSI
jgi:hypothetical protein